MAKRAQGRQPAGSGSIRIIAGQWRGRRLQIPATGRVRPTPDRVRETLFNWLAPWVAGARCLDLYAGTGALGFEALSRGAVEAWLVERDPRLVQALGQQARTLDAAARVVHTEAGRLLQKHAGADKEFGAFDIVFVDPPYDVPVAPVLEKLPRALAPQALVYVERAADSGLPEAPPGSTWFRRGRAGAVTFGVLSYGTVEPEQPSSEGAP